MHGWPERRAGLLAVQSNPNWRPSNYPLFGPRDRSFSPTPNRVIESARLHSPHWGGIAAVDPVATIDVTMIAFSHLSPRFSLLRSLTSISLVLLTCSCSWNSHHSDPQRVRRSDAQFKLRDECLKRNASALAPTAEDVSVAATAVALSCKTESEKLDQIVNVSRAPEVTESIHQTAIFRASGFIMKARGAPSGN